MSNAIHMQNVTMWKAQPVSTMTRDELEQAFAELNRMYQGAITEIGQRRVVQLVPVEVADNSPSVIVAMLSAMVLMAVLIGVVAVVL